MKTFNDLEFKLHPARIGTQARIDFPNGFGASIVRCDFLNHGSENGLYELSVLKAKVLCYDTPITDDVLGHLSPDQVTTILADIEALPVG